MSWSGPGLAEEVIERLIRVGGLDSLGRPRRELLWQLREVAGTTKGKALTKVARRAAGRPMDLRLPATEAPELPPLSETERLGDAYAVIGLDAQSQVVGLFRPALERLGAVTNAALAERRPGRVRIGGLVVTRQHPMTAKGTVFLALEDETGMVNVTLWPDTWARLRGVVRRHALLLVDGELQREANVVNVVAREARPLPEEARHGSVARADRPASASSVMPGCAASAETSPIARDAIGPTVPSRPRAFAFALAGAVRFSRVGLTVGEGGAPVDPRTRAGSRCLRRWISCRRRAHGPPGSISFLCSALAAGRAGVALVLFVRVELAAPAIRPSVLHEPPRSHGIMRYAARGARTPARVTIEPIGRRRPGNRGPRKQGQQSVAPMFSDPKATTMLATVSATGIRNDRPRINVGSAFRSLRTSASWYESRNAAKSPIRAVGRARSPDWHGSRAIDGHGRRRCRCPDSPDPRRLPESSPSESTILGDFGAIAAARFGAIGSLGASHWASSAVGPAHRSAARALTLMRSGMSVDSPMSRGCHRRRWSPAVSPTRLELPYSRPPYLPRREVTRWIVPGGCCCVSSCSSTWFVRAQCGAFAAWTAGGWPPRSPGRRRHSSWLRSSPVALRRRTSTSNSRMPAWAPQTWSGSRWCTPRRPAPRSRRRRAGPPPGRSIRGSICSSRTRPGSTRPRPMRRTAAASRRRAARSSSGSPAVRRSMPSAGATRPTGSSKGQRLPRRRPDRAWSVDRAERPETASTRTTTRPTGRSWFAGAAESGRDPKAAAEASPALPTRPASAGHGRRDSTPTAAPTATPAPTVVATLTPTTDRDTDRNADGGSNADADRHADRATIEQRPTASHIDAHGPRLPSEWPGSDRDPDGDRHLDSDAAHADVRADADVRATPTVAPITSRSRTLAPWPTARRSRSRAS